MTTLDHLLGFESALMDWMLCVPPDVLAADPPGRDLLRARQHVYDLINDVVADARIMARLDELAAAELAELVTQLRQVPQERSALTSTYELVREFLAVVRASMGAPTQTLPAAPTGRVSGEHVIGKRTSAA